MVDDEWYYSIVNVVGVLSESPNPRDYWYRLKKMSAAGYDELSTNCRQLKMKALDNKIRATDCANREGIFRIIQSIPSPNVEPFKLWFAHLAEERIEEIIDPSLDIERARSTYLKKGYTEEWTNAKIELTN